MQPTPLFPQPLSTGLELIVGGQKSGKSRRAEVLAAQWLQAHPSHQAVLVATAEAWDDEMRQRIARHQADRRQRVPRMQTVELPPGPCADLGERVRALSQPNQLVVVDCLTLWLTRSWMPPEEQVLKGFDENKASSIDGIGEFAMFFNDLTAAPGPVVIVSNEIGLGVIPMGADVRRFVDQLGQLNQRLAACAQRVVLMVAGQPLVVKG